MILVTGGSGFVGTALLPVLVARGEPVRALSRRPIAVAGVESYKGDLLDPASLEAALHDATGVVHLAAALGSSNLTDADIRRTNVEGTANLATAAVKAGVRRFVLMSSAGVYGDGTDLRPRDEYTTLRPQTTYQRSKLESEDVAASTFRGTAISWGILRPTEIHGPRQHTLRFYQRVIHRRVWVHGPPHLIVHPTYVGDVVNATMLALEQPFAPGTVFNIAGAEALTFPALIDRVARRLHVRARHVQLPAQPTRLIAHIAMRLTLALGQTVPSFERVQRPIINHSVDISVARKVLGFDPCPLDDAIDATIASARRDGCL